MDRKAFIFNCSEIDFPVVFKIMELIITLEDRENKTSLSHFSLEIFEDIRRAPSCFSSALQTSSGPQLVYQMLDALIPLYNITVDYLTLQGTYIIIFSYWKQ